MGWWAIHTHRPLVLATAFCLITLKPQTVLLTGALFLYGMRDWSRRDILIALSLPALALITSPLIAGLDWPLRLLRFMRDHDVAYHRAITIWRIADLVTPVKILRKDKLFAFVAAHSGKQKAAEGK